MRTRIAAALHELRCAECRVTWRSWAQRLVGMERRWGFPPSSDQQATPDEPGEGETDAR